MARKLLMLTDHVVRRVRALSVMAGSGPAGSKRGNDGRKESMSKNAAATKPGYGLLLTDIAGFDSVAELALDMRWSWNHATDHIWRQLNPDLWELTHNPWVVLQTVSLPARQQ